MKSLKTTGCFLLLSVFCSSFSAKAVTEAQFTDVLAKVLKDSSAASLSAAVAVDGKLDNAVAVGYADKANDIKATVQTLYRTGSVSKVITTTAFMPLVEQQKVSLEDSISQYLPYLPEHYQPVTLKHLFSHTSGVRHYQFGEYGTNIHYPSLEAATRVFRDDPLRFSPGSAYLYSTYGINLIQGVIESVSGQSLSDYLTQALWQKAGMIHTQLEVSGQQPPTMAVGYRKWPSFMPVKDIDVSNKYVGGGMLTTPSDLVRMTSALMNGKLMQDATREKMLSVAFPEASKDQAIGWIWREYKGHRAFSHSGGINGFESFLLHLPELSISVALMVNVDDFDYTGRTTYQLLDLYLSELKLTTAMRVE
ncbi:serine hydrolase [Aliiglaciecola sp. CAU 1673]|uniref:serine hydrolase domain-containing protein n=1 Tax=Aliiglaciecola sp. CAU 1673 TaxID=3032595 RepID=UPI0023DB4330|nr:serine hydrolase domain-containing protein [Aliiglaciecola sp. CAU 1673]MDF2178095.1 serine hydrolase [Aliiglaciecola sp. CAU 1673]